MSVALKGALQGDPRRPDEFVPYKKSSADDDVPDFMQLGALLLGMAGVFLKTKALCWASLFLALSCAAQSAGKPNDTRQIMTAIMFSISGIITNYMQARMIGGVSTNPFKSPETT